MSYAGETKELDFMDLPVRIDLSLRKGDSYRQGWTIKADTGAGATAIDFTNVTFTLGIDDEDGTSKVTGTEDTTSWTKSGVSVDDADAGQITLCLAAADAGALAAGEYTYEVKATWSAGDASWPSLVKTLFAGRLTIEPDTI